MLISICDLLGDTILIYRCWVLWDRNYWITILPTLTAVGGFGKYCACFMVYPCSPHRPACIVEIAHASTSIPYNTVPPAFFIPLQTAGYVLPLCTNVMASGLIVYRIWQAASISSGGGGSGVPRLTVLGSRHLPRTASAVVIESGLLYLAVQLVFVVLVSLEHPAQDIVAVIAVQIYVRRVGSPPARESTALTDAWSPPPF